MSFSYANAREFIYRNARPIDIARFQYHFENGSKEAVLIALAAYQNKDGGFGHALEPDAWNPNSSPIQTWTATEILREIDFTDSGHPIFQGILQYLASGKNFNGNFWYNTIKSNNDYPHAPWWYTESDSTCHNDYNPTACFAGFILRFAPKDSNLYQLGLRISKEAVDSYLGQKFLDDMHTVGCYIRLLQYLEDAAIYDAVDTTVLRKKLKEQVKYNITADMSKWETDYVCKPSQFFNNTNSIFYDDNKVVAKYECDFIARTQLCDGSWTIPWGWADYPEEWAISKNWWKSNGILLNLLYLNGISH